MSISKENTNELKRITNDKVTGIGQIENIKSWLRGTGLPVDSVDEKTVERLLKVPEQLSDRQRRVLEIRKTLSSSSVKKLYAIDRMTCKDGRIKDIFQYCGAERTGRFAGRGPQPQNLPKSGPDVFKCPGCGAYYGIEKLFCPVC